MITLRLAAVFAVIVSTVTLAAAQTPPPAAEAKPAAANASPPKLEPAPAARPIEQAKPVEAEAKPAAANATPPKLEPAPAAKPVEQAKPAVSVVPPPPPKPVLAVEAGSGAFAQAYRETVLIPFESQTGTRINAPGKDGAGEADILMLDTAALDRGCRDGTLAELDIAKLEPDSSRRSARDDFLDGALKPCGIGQMAWSMLFVFDPAKHAKRQPRTIADIFDVKRFPGKRALPANGRGLFEALMAAEGTAAGDIYRKLDSEDGLARATARLASIVPHVVWYERMGDAISLLRSGEATIALTSSGHAFVEQARSGPLGLLWDSQVLDVSYLAVRKSTADQNRAKDLIAFATAPERLAAMARLIPYGPMRRSAIALAVRHSVTGQELAQFLPTTPTNLETAIRFDAAWWQANETRVRDAITTARQTPPAPATAAPAPTRKRVRR